MKIAVITPGRSHLLDMSIQLIKNGYNVTFYTIVPKKRCQKYGLNKKNVVSFFAICGPLMFLYRKFKFPGDFNRFIYFCINRIVDYLSCIFLHECDLIITISGCSIKAIEKAKTKYNAHVICDRGCKHILSQDEILKTIPTAKQVYKRDISIELKEYELADIISLPSSHSMESFIIHGFPKHKLFVNPYGVNINIFHPLNSIIPKFDIIFVGNWSYQKGVDLLIEACNRQNYSLLHVGNIIDCEFPQYNNFMHVDAVNQLDLINYYAQARILALPSRQDGFGLVLFQAMACGLPLVYSHNTGGPDLRELVENKEFLFEMEEYSISSLIESIDKALIAYKRLPGTRNYLTSHDLNQISWDAYGHRYNDFIIKTFANA